MSNFPNSYDDDTTLPPINDNIQDLGAEAINALRDFAFNTEQYLGLGGAGTTDSISSRLGISIDPDGNIKPSAIASLGLITLPITNDQISNSAEIPESKLKLDHRTQDLFNYIQDLSGNVNSALGWISITGIKLEPHLFGAIYRHSLNQIDVSSNPINFLKNKFESLRDNTDSYTVLNDLNNEFLNHQFLDGTGTSSSVINTIGGSNYPSNYAHTASGIFLNTNRFSTIPQTAKDLQQFAEFIDSSSIFLYGTRIQNLYTNGISKTSRSVSLQTDGYGAPVITSTPAIAYLLNTGNNSEPFDDIDAGDDIIEFKPSAIEMSSNSFDEKFALVRVGDIIRINYGSVEVQFIIKEKKYIQNGGNKKYVVRINGKNLFYSVNASARIDRSLVNSNKYGVLSIAAANNAFADMPSLIIGNPRGAQILGIGFSPDQLDATHYSLYLAIYPTGSPVDGYTILPGIDVTGNRGATPGLYTLDSVVEATNTIFRQAGYNYRFIAFSHQGEFGIMLADSYSNTAFSVLSGVVSDGVYDVSSTSINFQNNVVDVFNVTIDPLGFGINNANIASPPFMISYESAESALIPTKLFLPLKKNNYYVNGIEREKLTLEVGQILDGYGDGYWAATIKTVNIFPGPSPTGRVQTTYHIPLDLSTTNLKIGKTIVVQSLGQGGLVDYGRFIIQDINFHVNCPTVDVFTDITVYDAVHGTAVSPSSTLSVDGRVAIYFNSDSVSFNKETATDIISVSPFKRNFEILIDQNGNTFTHERGRINVSNGTINVNGNIPLYTFSELSKLNIVKISSKLRGYPFGAVRKITLFIINYDNVTGIYSGYLSLYNGILFSNLGPIVSGKKGQITRFYDETNIDYIDIVFDINQSIASFSNHMIDFQLFPTLSLDDELMLIGSCQLNDVTNTVNYIKDERQFGNTSEKDLSTSALNFISLPEKLLHSNGVIRGFDLQDISIISSQLYLSGGLALVNGKFIQMNNEAVSIPFIKEQFVTLFNVNWALCVNDKGEYQPIPLLDFDTTLNTPNAPTRIFNAFNVLNGSTYSLDAVTFSDIINNRKDLTILYIVSSVVVTTEEPPTILLSPLDVRKYINDGDSNLPLKLTSGNAQGNFKNPVSILNWIKYNNTFNGTAIVKGADINSGVIDTSLILDFDNTVIIDGENDALLTMNGPVTIGSNLVLKNLDIVFNGNITLSNNIKNLTFENCNVTINVNTTPPNNIVFDILGGDNILIKDCSINITYLPLLSNLVVFRGSAFRATNTTNFMIEDSVIAVNYEISAGVNTPGNIFTLVSSNDVVIKDSVFSGNFNKFLDNSNSNNLKLYDLSITSTYNPNAGGSPDAYNSVSYSTSNLVNSGQGYIYSNVTNILDNIEIDNIIFNYNPSINTNDRYSFINFELSTNASVLSNLNIINCKFNNMNVSGTKDDVRAAISIINTAPVVVTPNQQPILSNVNISNNKCNKNQSIIITSTLASGLMVFPALVAQSCQIVNNICGSIGYWIGSETKVVGISPNVNSFSDRMSGLLIDNNICHVINNVDQVGKYFLVSKVISGTTVNQSNYPSGRVIISDNKCNWIHTGIAYEEDSSLHIVENICTAYDAAYLNNYQDAVPNAISNPSVPGLPVSTEYAIFVSANKVVTPTINNPGEGNNSSCIISGNITNVGYWSQTSLTNFVYKYGLGYIYCQSSCNINNNILQGVSETVGSGSLILLGGLTNIVTENKIYRKANSIFAYVAYVNFDLPSIYDGAATIGIVTDNYFDSPFISDISKSEAVINLTLTSINTSRWIIDRNINQTNTLYISSNQGIQKFSQQGALQVLAGDNRAGFAVTINPTASNLTGIQLVYKGLVATATINHEWDIALSSIIPKNAFITSVTFTAAANHKFDTTGFTTGVLYKSNTTTNLVLNQSPAGDFTSSTGTFTYSISDISSPNVIAPLNRFMNTGTSDIGLYIITSQLDDGTVNPTIVVAISPITIKYRW